MDKKRVAITLDRDVLAFIDDMAGRVRLERSAYINQHFAATMPGDYAPPQSLPTPKRAKKGKAQA